MCFKNGEKCDVIKIYSPQPVSTRLVTLYIDYIAFACGATQEERKYATNYAIRKRKKSTYLEEQLRIFPSQINRLKGSSERPWPKTNNSLEMGFIEVYGLVKLKKFNTPFTE